VQAECGDVQGWIWGDKQKMSASIKHHIAQVEEMKLREHLMHACEATESLF
jgi:hypothetical protein